MLKKGEKNGGRAQIFHSYAGILEKYQGNYIVFFSQTTSSPIRITTPGICSR